MDTCAIDGPPFIKRGRKVIYEHEAVARWIAGLNPMPTRKSPPYQRPGRPTKADQIARRASAG